VKAKESECDFFCRYLDLSRFLSASLDLFLPFSSSLELSRSLSISLELPPEV
jgi:hypothetical protein